MSGNLSDLFDINEIWRSINSHNSTNKSDPEDTCDNDIVISFGTKYKGIHGYIALMVCVSGAIANILIMVVLTRKEMRTPVNLMLLALAIADLLIMLEYIPFALHMYVVDNPPEVKYSFHWAILVFLHVHFTQILHTISIQLVSHSFVHFLETQLEINS